LEYPGSEFLLRYVDFLDADNEIAHSSSVNDAESEKSSAVVIKVVASARIAIKLAITIVNS
jgi:hypothetical protein